MTEESIFHKRIREAKTGRKILTASSGDLKSLFLEIFTLLGISRDKHPQPESFIKFLKEEYPTITLEEIELAFKLGIKGTTQVDLKLYDRIFSAQYFCQVIRAYNTFAAQTIGEEIKRKRAL